MRTRFFATPLLLAAALGGCSDVEPGTGGRLDTDAPVVNLPATTASISGVLYDPEGFFVTMFNFPAEPGHEDDLPPPAVFGDSPYLANVLLSGGEVRVSGPEGFADSPAARTAESGAWQVNGVAVNGETPYLVVASPSAEGVSLPAEQAVPLPQATYYPTKSLRPILANVTQCYGQTALMVGNAGALDAVAQRLTELGTPTTVADLLDPAKTGGVSLLWVHTPSDAFDFFLSPMDSVAGEATAGQLIALDWFPVDPETGPAPGQSPMGFAALPDPMSMIGYFALVLPPGVTEPVEVRFTDTYTSLPEDDTEHFGPRPWKVPSITVEPGSGLTVGRTFAEPNLPPFEDDPMADPGQPPPDVSWTCMAPPPGGEEPPPEG